MESLHSKATAGLFSFTIAPDPDVQGPGTGTQLAAHLLAAVCRLAAREAVESWRLAVKG